jgi:hypothetical protein
MAMAALQVAQVPEIHLEGFEGVECEKCRIYAFDLFRENRRHKLRSNKAVPDRGGV